MTSSGFVVETWSRTSSLSILLVRNLPFLRDLAKRRVIRTISLSRIEKTTRYCKDIALGLPSCMILSSISCIATTRQQLAKPFKLMTLHTRCRVKRGLEPGGACP